MYCSNFTVIVMERLVSNSSIVVVVAIVQPFFHWAILNVNVNCVECKAHKNREKNDPSYFETDDPKHGTLFEWSSIHFSSFSIACSSIRHAESIEILLWTWFCNLASFCALCTRQKQKTTKPYVHWIATIVVKFSDFIRLNTIFNKSAHRQTAHIHRLCEALCRLRN